VIAGASRWQEVGCCLGESRQEVVVPIWNDCFEQFNVVWRIGEVWKGVSREIVFIPLWFR